MYISQVSIKLHKIYYQADCFYFKFATLSLSGPSMPQAVVLHLQRLSTQHPTLPRGISPLSSLLSPQATCSSSLSPVDDPDSSSTKRIESVVRVPPARPLHFAPYTCLPACRCKVFPHASPSTCALTPTFLLQDIAPAVPPHLPYIIGSSFSGFIPVQRGCYVTSPILEPSFSLYSISQ